MPKFASSQFLGSKDGRVRIDHAKGTIFAGDENYVTADTGWKKKLYSVAPFNFTDHSNVKDSDDTYATVTTATSQIYGGFDFDIPNNAEVLGIEVLIEGHDNSGFGGTPATVRAQVSWDNNVTFSSQTAYTLSLADSNDVTGTIGAADYLFGRSWTVAELLGENFGVKLQIVAMNSATTVSIDYIAVRITYRYQSNFQYDGTDARVNGGSIQGGSIRSAESGARIEMVTRALRSYDDENNKRIEMNDDRISFFLEDLQGLAAFIYTAGNSSNPLLIFQPPSNGNLIMLNPLFYGSYDGWINNNETWTYASSTTFTVSGDVTGKYSAGMKVRMYQSGYKYFFITKVAYSSPNTTITVYGGTDYTIANAAITTGHFSPHKAPLNFPLDPAKWTIETTNATEQAQATPVQNTWYNLGSLSIAIPIGAWNVEYMAQLGTGDSAGVVGSAAISLSTSSSSESDNTMTAVRYATFGTAASDFYVDCHRRRSIILTSDTTYYLIERTTTSGVDTLRINSSSGANTVIRAVCAYL